MEMIGRLIGFPTVSRESNLELIDFVREYLRNGVGASAELLRSGDRLVIAGVIMTAHIIMGFISVSLVLAKTWPNPRNSSRRS